MYAKPSALLEEGIKIAAKLGVEQGGGNLFDSYISWEGDFTPEACGLGFMLMGLEPEKTWEAHKAEKHEHTTDFPNNEWHGELFSLPVTLLEATGMMNETRTIDNSHPLVWVLGMNDDMHESPEEMLKRLKAEGF